MVAEHRSETLLSFLFRFVFKKLLLRGQQEAGLGDCNFNELQEKELNLPSKLLCSKVLQPLEHLLRGACVARQAHDVGREPIV